MSHLGRLTRSVGDISQSGLCSGVLSKLHNDHRLLFTVEIFKPSRRIELRAEPHIATCVWDKVQFHRELHG